VRDGGHRNDGKTDREREAGAPAAPEADSVEHDHDLT